MKRFKGMGTRQEISFDPLPQNPLGSVCAFEYITITPMLFFLIAVKLQTTRENLKGC